MGGFCFAVERRRIRSVTMTPSSKFRTCPNDLS
jgi:hypothetical protein